MFLNNFGTKYRIWLITTIAATTDMSYLVNQILFVISIPNGLSHEMDLKNLNKNLQN
jgi:hypothetical protein